MPDQQSASQAEVINYLLTPAPWPVAGPVEHIETHGAHVFLCGDVALKIKRAVRYDYMDQSSLDLRHDLLQRELALNRKAAPMVYRDVIAVTRTGQGGPEPGGLELGGLELGGAGPVVEWVLRMHRFPRDCEMTEVAASGRFTDQVAEDLGRTIRGFHAGCPLRSDAGDALIGDILDELARVLAAYDTTVGSGLIEAFLAAARGRLDEVVPVLIARAENGHVRRVHGDLHLRNILLIDGKPVLFDALEFDERLATCDVLYDLAFLAMDLCHRDLRRQANATLGAYLLAAAGAEDTGLSAFPLFLSVRAAIRAMVILQTDEATGRAKDRAAGGVGANTPEARLYLTQALQWLRPQTPVLIAVGGVSGTGKTVLARGLAPRLGPCPGAVHLRTDTERKTRDPGPFRTPSYSPAARAVVYVQMLARAERLLSAGRSVILDGTFLDAAQRDAATAVASRLGLRFRGLWLSAPPPVLIARVAARRGDASDADAGIVAAQIADAPAAPVAEQGADWTGIDASGSVAATTDAAIAALADIAPPDR